MSFLEIFDVQDCSGKYTLNRQSGSSSDHNINAASASETKTLTLKAVPFSVRKTNMPKQILNYNTIIILFTAMWDLCTTFQQIFSDENVRFQVSGTVGALMPAWDNHDYSQAALLRTEAMRASNHN